MDPGGHVLGIGPHFSKNSLRRTFCPTILSRLQTFTLLCSSSNCSTHSDFLELVVVVGQH